MPGSMVQRRQHVEITFVLRLHSANAAFEVAVDTDQQRSRATPVNRMLDALARVATYTRHAWTAVGIALILLIGLEGAYRAQRALKDRLATPPRATLPAHPNAGETWWTDWYVSPIFRQYHRYDPYRGWGKRVFSSPWINVDEHGRRITPQSPLAIRRRVLLLGGSTMWGYSTRDSATIPALVARGLAARGISDVEIVNLAQPAYNSTQGLVSTMLELREGRRVDFAVFLDGHNDVAAAVQARRAGAVLNEPRYAELLERGFPTARRAAADLASQLRFVPGLGRAVGLGQATDTATVDAASLCADVASVYAGVIRTTEALAAGGDFGVAFLWQPMLATSGKPRSEWERSLPDPVHLEVLRVCTVEVERTLAAATAARFESLTRIFDADSTSVFLDHSGHVTERANGVIADRILEVLLPALAVDGRMTGGKPRSAGQSP